MMKKKNNNKPNLNTVEIDAILYYDEKDREVKIKKMITNEMPFELSFSILEALNKTISDYYGKG